MRKSSWRTAGLLGALGALGALLLVAIRDEKTETDEPTAPLGTTEPERSQPERERGPARAPRAEEDARGGAPAERRLEPDEAAARAASRAYRAYVAAINARDGERICELVAPGLEEVLEPPVRRGDCGERISSSIGYEDPRGFPVWERTLLSGIEGIRVAGRSVQVNAAVLTRFADREQPSVESDIAYLERSAGRWRLAKPSGALYRAVGKPEVPPEAIVPP